MPAGLLTTVPPGDAVTASVTGGRNVAVTDSAADMTTVQLAPFVEVQPVHALKVEFAAATAVRVTVELAAKPAEQVAPQLMLPSLLVTVPVPEPDLLTVRVLGGRKDALTAAFETPRVMVQVAPFVEVQPVQPLKVEFAVAVAVSVTVEEGA